MKKRERLDAELEEVHRQLARMSTGASVLQPSRRASSIDPEDESPDDAEKRIVAPGQLTTSAFQLAGYAVATLTLGRSIPATIVLDADAEYDVGRCSEADLHSIWAVGDLAAERARRRLPVGAGAEHRHLQDGKRWWRCVSRRPEDRNRGAGSRANRQTHSE